MIVYISGSQLGVRKAFSMGRRKP